MTFPRLLALRDAYEERKARTLHEIGIAVNLAFHAPKKLEKAFRVQRHRAVDMSGKWWGPKEART